MGEAFWVTQCVDRLERHDIVGTRAFFALADFKLNLLVLFESCVTVHLDLGVVDEQIRAAAIGTNETKTFACVEPLDCTCTHCILHCP